MLKKLSAAALVAAMSCVSVPAMVVTAHAQANEPPTAPDPSEAAKGGDMSKGDMSKGDMSKGDMSSSKSMKKSKHSMKKKHHHM